MAAAVDPNPWFLKRGKEKMLWTHPDHHFGSRAHRRPAHLAPQQVLGTLSRRRNRIDPFGFDHPVANGANLRELILTPTA